MLVYRPQPPEPDHPSQLGGSDRRDRVRDRPAKVSADKTASCAIRTRRRRQRRP